ncbi:hypothetical protein LIP_1992 [Limnochorda pilosa]|uniref:ABC transporter substrate-binding protein n=1 Tax=Limnochorda pilosa TaxID=1555112 RepID=A0A0K2SL42_LIMPI|nr:hypothetical protein LIP_1992 [Limnochorda pilosa]
MLGRLSRLVAVVAVVAMFGPFLTVQASAQAGATLEIAAFQGGYGIEWLKEIAARFEQEHPGVKVEVWGNPRVWEQLRPRFISGNPPDLVAPGWGFDVWSAIYEGQVQPLDDLLGSPAVGQEGRWMDTFIQDLWAPMAWEGHYYIMPLFMNIFSWWYDEALWQKEGWQVPETWEQFVAVADAIKQAGYYPISVQGVDFQYLNYGLLLPTVARLGGMQVLEDAFNLKPGAWQHPAFVQAARIWQDAAREYFPPGWEGANHTESQMLLVLDQTAMLPVGSWLPSEMANVTPPTTRLRAMTLPSFGRPDGVMALPVESDQPTNFLIPSKAKNPELAGEFLKFMTSPEMARIIVEATGAPLAVRGSEEALPSEAVRSAVALLAKTEATYDFRNTVEIWYPQIWQAMVDAGAALLQGQISPEEWARRLEQAATSVRNDAKIPKHHLALGT